MTPTPPRRGLAVAAGSIESMAAAAAAADAAGFDSVWAPELYNRSASITLAALALATTDCALGSGIMYGVGRSPLILAAEARDLDELSAGRLILGLGNGTRRMISDWHGLDGTAPASRMEELVPLIRRLWRLGEGPVDHHGRFYHVKIDAIDETPATTREIPIYTAGVNPRMIETAGRVADGLLGHSLFSPRYIEEVVLPSIERGARHSERDPDDIGVVAFVLTATDDDEERARREAAAMIAFYCTVKTYAPLLEICGFAREAAAIRDAFGRRDVDAMLAGVSDEMIDEFAVAGRPAEVNARLARFEGIADHVVMFPPTFRMDAERVTRTASMLIDQCGPLAA